MSVHFDLEKSFKEKKSRTFSVRLLSNYETLLVIGVPWEIAHHSLRAPWFMP